VFYPKNFEQKIGFDQIREILKQHCLSELGKKYIDSELFSFSDDYETVKTRIDQTDEFKQLITMEDNFPTSYYIDVRPSLEKLRPITTFMDVNELFDLRRSLDSIKSVARFIQTKAEKYPQLAKLTEKVQLYPFVSERIDAIINKYGVIRDNASPDLSQIRRKMAEQTSNITRILNQVLRQAQQNGWVEADASLTMRDGKMLIPISTTHKRKIRGFIHDESATGKTSFLEPIEIVEANNDLRDLEFAERREILNILIAFANELRPYIDDLLVSYDFLAEIDFIRAKAQFAIRLNGIKPNTYDPEPKLDWLKAIHPLLFLTFQPENKTVVPLNIQITEKEHLILISGPNAGGKSVCLKTVGLLQYMFQCGLLVPMQYNSSIGLFERIFIDIGDEQSLENDLSTYSSHLRNMRFFVENANANTLVLIDEFGAGTEPIIGGAIAESILEELNNNQVKGVITTHYTNLKHFATSVKGVVNAAMLFDNNKMQPLFQLEIGLPGSSFAFEIAHKIGLPESVMKRAESKVGQKHMDFDRQLKEIEEDRRALENQKKSLIAMEEEMKKTVQTYKKEIDFTVKQRKNILSITNEQVRDTLANANKQIENAIFEIRKANAEKEKTKEARQKLDDFKRETLEKQRIESEKIDAKIELLKQKKNEAQKIVVESEVPDKEEVVPDNSFHVGDKVKIVKQDAVGEIIEMRGEKAVVSFGNMQTFMPLARLEKISSNQAKKLESKTDATLKAIGWQPKKSKADFVFGLDVRGLRADDALYKVSRYLDEAIISGAFEVKILHGTGGGILRQLIRDYLKTADFVKSFHDESIEFGGAGITVVEMEF